MTLKVLLILLNYKYYFTVSKHSRSTEVRRFFLCYYGEDLTQRIQTVVLRFDLNETPFLLKEKGKPSRNTDQGPTSSELLKVKTKLETVCGSTEAPYGPLGVIHT